MYNRKHVRRNTGFQRISNRLVRERSLIKGSSEYTINEQNDNTLPSTYIDVDGDIYTIEQFPNGKWYYRWYNSRSLDHIVGPYETQDEAVKFLKRHRKTVQVTNDWKYNGNDSIESQMEWLLEHNNNYTKQQNDILTDLYDFLKGNLSLTNEDIGHKIYFLQNHNENYIGDQYYLIQDFELSRFIDSKPTSFDKNSGQKIAHEFSKDDPHSRIELNEGAGRKLNKLNGISENALDVIKKCRKDSINDIWFSIEDLEYYRDTDGISDIDGVLYDRIIKLAEDTCYAYDNLIKMIKELADLSQKEGERLLRIEGYNDDDIRKRNPHYPYNG